MTPPTNPEPATDHELPRTDAGLRLARELRTLNLTDDPESWWPDQIIAAIEAAARAEALAELRRGVEGLGSPVGSGVFAIYRQGWADACLAVLALLPDPPK